MNMMRIIKGHNEIDCDDDADGDGDGYSDGTSSRRSDIHLKIPQIRYDTSPSSGVPITTRVPI